uniref:Uncharacterized protein n=1 Tax=Arundo donax TaxID=35708 RepID=A0A0A9C796_ARUDO
MERARRARWSGGRWVYIGTYGLLNLMTGRNRWQNSHSIKMMIIH